jgi:putative FmdB family regulatory protein
MPLYEYQCEECGERFETMQKFSDQPLTRHDKCGGTVHRLISAPALQFKGSGWYVNDYARTSKPESDGAPKKPETAPAASSSTESSTKASKPTNSTDKKVTSSDTKGD